MRNLHIYFIVKIFLFTGFSTLANNTTTPIDSFKFDEMTFGASKAKTSTATGAFGEEINKNRGQNFNKSVNKNSPEMVRKPKKLAGNYTGYAIELTTVFNKPLEPTDKLFQLFGGLVIEQHDGNTYSYLLCNFTTKKALDTYKKQVVQDKYPQAKGLKYKNGRRVKF